MSKLPRPGWAKKETMKQPYCVMASFAVVDDEDDAYKVQQSLTAVVFADSKNEARQLGKQRIAAHVPAGSSWDGEISVYGKEQFDTLRQLGILPGEAEKGGNV
jgi:hypothetical protein